MLGAAAAAKNELTKKQISVFVGRAKAAFVPGGGGSDDCFPEQGFSDFYKNLFRYPLLSY